MRKRFLGVCFHSSSVGFLSRSCRASSKRCKGGHYAKDARANVGLRRPNDPATGTLDPLYARILILKAAGKRIALVALDLCCTFGEPSLDDLKEVVAKSSGISCLLVSASQDGTLGSPGH